MSETVKAPSNTTWPYLVPEGRGPVKIYRMVIRKEDIYSVDYYVAGKRQRKAYADWEKAKKAAKAAADAIKHGQANALLLNDKDRDIYVRALQHLQGLKVDVAEAARAYSAAVKVLGPEVSILEAVKDYKARHAIEYPAVTVEDVVVELLEAKKSGEQTKLTARKPRQSSDRYLYDLRLKLEAFAHRFSCPLSNVTTDDINSFLGDLEHGGRTKNNYRAAVSVLFEYAKFKSYLPPDHNVMDRVGMSAEDEFDIEIFPPEDMKKLLDAADDILKPCLALTAFAGVRSAEVCRLKWENIRFESKLIEVPGFRQGKRVAKTGARRLIPMPDNLIAWLRPHAATGPIWPHVEIYMFELQAKAAGVAGVEWKHNAPRHSWVSYRLATAQDAPKVALEAGNTPQMIFEHYNELVAPDAAKAWFAIMPERPANVIQATPLAATA